MSLLVCFGDQMIANEIEKDGTPRLTSRVRDRLHDWTVINSGSTTETITTSLFRFQDDVLRYQPDIVAISFSMGDASYLEQNDLLEIEKNLVIMVEKIKPGKAILVTPYPGKDAISSDLKEHLLSYTNVIRRVQATTDCHLIDLWSIVENKNVAKRIKRNQHTFHNYIHSLLSELIVEKVHHITKRRKAKL